MLLAEPHPVPQSCAQLLAHSTRLPSRDGNRVLWASNWAQDCGTGCGSASNIKDYVVWSPSAVGVDDAPPMPAPATGIAMSELRPNPSNGLPAVTYSLV